MSAINNARYAIRLFFQSIYGEGNLEELALRYIKEKRDPIKDIQNFFSEIKHRPPCKHSRFNFPHKNFPFGK